MLVEIFVGGKQYIKSCFEFYDIYEMDVSVAYLFSGIRRGNVWKAN